MSAALVPSVLAAPAKKKPAAANAAAEPAPPPAPPPRPAFVVDPRWGVLGEVAERDFSTRNLFTFGTEVPIAFRWVVPNEELLLTYLGPPKGEHRLKLDPSTGEIERSWKNMWGTTREKLQVDPAGNVVIAGTTDMMFLRKNSDGTYWLRWSVDNKQTLTPLTTRSPKVAQLFADAAIPNGRPELSAPVNVAALASGGGSVPGPARVGPAAAGASAEPAFEFLEPGADTRGVIATPGEPHCYFFETTPGQKVTVQLNGGKGLDPYLVIGAGGTCNNRLRAFAQNDDFRGSLNSRIDFVAAGGTYVAQVWGIRKTTGDYALGIGEMATATRKLPVGLPVRKVVDPRFAPGMSASTAPPSGKPVPAKGTVIQDCPECPQMVVIPAGSFMMGSTASEPGHEADEGPRHMVMFARPFAIGKTEVTFDEWDACVKAKGCSASPADNGWGRGRRPVMNISWNEAMQYVRWLRRTTGEAYYLPSEAEWEYAARAGTQTPWNTGKAILTDDANILNALGRTVPVGGYPVNAFGIEGVHGNVSEFVADCYDVGYFGAPLNGGAVTAKACGTNVARGGSFSQSPAVARSANRWRPGAGARDPNVGFRVARAL